MYPISSRFSIYAYISAFTGLGVPLFTLVMFVWFIREDNIRSALGEHFLLIAFMYIVSVCVSLVIWFTSSGNWLVRIKISDYSISIRGFMGYGKEKEWLMKELDGYSVSRRRHSRIGSAEYVVVWKNGRKAVLLDEHFFTNYTDMKAIVTSKLKCMA